MGRWTQQEEDAARLPEGVKRVAYDADSARYTFRDNEGNIYVGPPHEEYGTLTMVKRGTGKASESDRPGAFAESNLKPGLSLEIVPHANDDGSTFHDFVPPHMIASPSSPQPSTPSRFRDAVRRTGTMQNVVNGLRRSVTSTRKPKPDGDKDGYGLLRGDSTIGEEDQGKSKLGRAKTRKE
uniref:Carbohydrate-binding module family 50 protein n=1 Tax=Mycena chlorophos TaxID=658473 RepID=A0ABQ0M4Y1_MYCCL|nr:predicted protein [Mycena chlorophos]